MISIDRKNDVVKDRSGSSADVRLKIECSSSCNQSVVALKVLGLGSTVERSIDVHDTLALKVGEVALQGAAKARRDTNTRRATVRVY